MTCNLWVLLVCVGQVRALVSQAEPGIPPHCVDVWPIQWDLLRQNLMDLKCLYPRHQIDLRGGGGCWSAKGGWENLYSVHCTVVGLSRCVCSIHIRTRIWWATSAHMFYRNKKSLSTVLHLFIILNVHGVWLFHIETFMQQQFFSKIFVIHWQFCYIFYLYFFCNHLPSWEQIWVKNAIILCHVNSGV